MWKPIKSRLLSSKFLVVLACTALNTPQAMLPTRSIQTWQPISGAIYYQGRLLQADGSKVRLRTTSSWLVLAPGTSLDIDAFDARGRNLGPVVLQTSPPATQQAPVVDDDVEEADHEPYVEEEDPEEAGSDEDTAVSSSTGTLGLTLAAGKEWIDAKGGSSKYSGSSSIGGTHLHLRWQDHMSPWLLTGIVGAHYFNTDVAAQGSSQAKGDEQFLRLGLRLGGLYDFLQVNGNKRALTAAVGLGLTHFRMPTLQIADGTNGAANLVNRSALGVDLLGLILAPLGSVDQLEGSLGYAPLLLSKGVKGVSSNASVLWRHDFDSELFTLFGLYLQTEKLRAPVDCPNVDGCVSDSSATSKILQARFGVGVAF